MTLHFPDGSVFVMSEADRERAQLCETNEQALALMKGWVDHRRALVDAVVASDAPR